VGGACLTDPGVRDNAKRIVALAIADTHLPMQCVWVFHHRWDWVDRAGGHAFLQIQAYMGNAG
jgi:hypothetical protein